MLGGGCGDSCCGQGRKEGSTGGTTLLTRVILLAPLITVSCPKFKVNPFLLLHLLLCGSMNACKTSSTSYKPFKCNVSQ